MAKLRFGDPDAGRVGRGRRLNGSDLPARRIRGEDGQLQTVFTLDAHSETVGDDVLALFRRNVRLARKATRDAMKRNGIAAE